MREVERAGSPQERDGGDRLLVGQHLGVGQAGGVVDADMHKLPANAPAVPAGRVAPAWAALQPALAMNAMPGAAGRDAPDLLTSMCNSSPG